MNWNVVAVGACAAVVFGSESAPAQYVVGAPIIVPSDNTIVTLEYVSFEAYYRGQLSFLGSGTLESVVSPATDTGLPGLGQQTFINQTGEPGGPIVLEGEYNAGDVLHFAYRVFEPSSAEDVLRTDSVDTRDQFAWDATDGRLHVEDLRPDDPWFDGDYNDLIVRVTFATVPSPGAVALLTLAACVSVSRRRRSA